MLSDKEFMELIEKYDYAFKPGDIIKGTVTGYEGKYVFVDINAKACAICPVNEVLLSDSQSVNDVLKQGESYDFIITSKENEDDVFFLSHKKVALYNNIKILEEKFKNDEIFTATITNIVKGGIVINVLGIKGFVPQSQIKVENYDINDNIEVKILSLDMSKNNFILSNKKVYSEQLEASKKEVFDKIKTNMVVKGKVVRLTDFGAFVDIGGVDGLLPLSQISWSWIDSPSDVLKFDDIIDVEIISIDYEKQRVSLSLKSLEENPWKKASEVIEDKKIVKGKVTRIKPFGAFVEVYPKVEGLLNKAQIEQYNEKYQKQLEENDEIEVLIKRFDEENQKINLEVV